MCDLGIPKCKDGVLLSVVFQPSEYHLAAMLLVNEWMLLVSLFLLERSCFTMLHCLLLYSKVNQPYICVCVCVCVYISPQQSTEFPVLFCRFSFIFCFVHSSVYMSVPVSQFTPPFPHLVSTCLFSTIVSLLLLWKYVHLYHFSRFRICVLIYDISFSDFPVW